MHGYDIVDHHALNPELGTEEEFEDFIAALKQNHLGQILDFVPNHMGVGGADNPLWLDVLEWGPDSAYSGWFDIDWEPEAPYLRDKLLVPFLAGQYGEELYAGNLVLKFEEEAGSFAVWAYNSHKLPICPLYYAQILGDAHPELERLGDAFRGLPRWRPQVGRRASDLKQELAQAARSRADVREAVEAAVRSFNGAAGAPASWRNLDALIANQYWRAAYFRVAADDINYRRFFNINDLAGIRMELPQVFEQTHELVLRLMAEGVLDGLRIDHVDGLLNPKEYLGRLRAAGRTASDTPFYLVVEKILSLHESLRDDWPVDGSTGYEFANLVLGLLIDPAGEESITRTYAQFTGERATFKEIVRDCKLRIMRNEMAGELNVLAREAARVAHQNPTTSDFTQNVLRRAIREVVACFPVYRTYVDAEGNAAEEDRRDLNWAMTQARSHEDVDQSVFDFVEKLISGDLVMKPRSGFSRRAVLRCSMKLQQYSGPVMAKGLEDTAFYRYNRFVALNEVGGHPEQFGISISKFHKANCERAKRWPDTMLATSTHDTKRGEDTRARLAVLSEMPGEWKSQVQAWSRILRARRGDIEGAAPPSRNEEYLFYQLLVGTWPVELTGGKDLDPVALNAYAVRLNNAMVKSIREAKVHSTWASPNRAYEDAVIAFVDSALQPEESGAFFASFLPFQESVARLGARNSLVQTTLKLTAPGMPDIYQGADLWDLSLVDPDNRRPVNYEERIRLLDQIEADGDQSAPSELLDQWENGAIKLFVTARLLKLRAERPEVFSSGGYDALLATGSNSEVVCSFARSYESDAVVVAVARFPFYVERMEDWGDTAIPIPGAVSGARLRDVLSGQAIEGDTELRAESVFRHLPVAVLVKD
jgi:(1->4)-alpha-D-glucan 1-alpha-D-glucosylmutase